MGAGVGRPDRAAGRGLPVPDLIAAVDDPPLVVLKDLGDGPSLADALLGADAATATQRLYAWVDALATLHAATTGDAPQFAAAMGAGAGTVDSMPDLLAGAADLLTAPADACPDNNVVTPAGLVLLDFEQATVCHVAWDAAYLLVPWPSCWCSWGLPTEVSRAALARWRAAVAPSIPVVESTAFDRDLDVCVVAWAFLSSAWFLARAIDEEHEAPGGGLRGPTRRAVIRHRMGLAAQRSAVMPALADLAEKVLTVTAQRWGDLRLQTAPAYR